MSHIKVEKTQNGIVVTKGNAVLTCLIKEGDKVRVHDFWGPKLGGKEATVKSVEYIGHSESGFICKINIYDGELDANWLIKLSPDE